MTCTFFSLPSFLPRFKEAEFKLGRFQRERPRFVSWNCITIFQSLRILQEMFLLISLQSTQHQQLLQFKAHFAVILIAYLKAIDHFQLKKKKGNSISGTTQNPQTGTVNSDKCRANTLIKPYCRWNGAIGKVMKDFDSLRSYRTTALQVPKKPADDCPNPLVILIGFYHPNYRGFFFTALAFRFPDLLLPVGFILFSFFTPQVFELKSKTRGLKNEIPKSLRLSLIALLW